MDKIYDIIVIGGGACGTISAIKSAQDGKKVLLLEKLPYVASKLRATGGGRCNLTNTLPNSEFMAHFGKNGRFMQDAIESFNHKDLQTFFKTIGVDTHSPDGKRIFPTSHSSATIIDALISEMKRLHVEVLCSKRVIKIVTKDERVSEVKTKDESFKTKKIILATGGLGYPTLGSDGDGHTMASSLGHTINELYPAMMPLHTKERWVSTCRADTISHVEIKVDMKKHKKLRAYGDLIFTKNGIRGPVVLDFAREITPLLSKYSEVPILLNLTKGMNENSILQSLKKSNLRATYNNIWELISTILPTPLAKEICTLAEINLDTKFSQISGVQKEQLLKLLAWTPLTVVGNDGFKMAMITRGGINLKEIEPKTMQSKKIKGLFFCGEIVDIDGPCGGYNLQWSFSSGVLASKDF